MNALLLLRMYWKYLAGLLVIAALFGAGAHWQAGRDEVKAGKVAERQAQRDAIAAATYAKAVQERDEAERAASAANARIYADLEPKLAASVADGARLARLLHDALAAAPSGSAGPSVPSQPPAPEPSGVPAGVPAISGPIERATADVFAACARDSARLTALQAEVSGQIE